MNTDINKIIQKSIPFAFIILLAYIVATVVFVYLPKAGVDYIQESKTNLEYRKFDGFYSATSPTKSVKKQEVSKKQVRLSSYNLKAIYSTAQNSGWIIVENKSGSKSHILSHYEQLDGYILTKLFKHYVIFEKAAKEYRLDIKRDKSVNYKISRTVNNIDENVIVSNGNVKVKRDYLNSYVQDIDKVWQNIAISEIRKDEKISGFKVDRVNKSSVFSKLGLKKGDVIKAINNNVLSSYADAFKVYNNINSTKYLNIEILRNNETMELSYEID